MSKHDNYQIELDHAERIVAALKSDGHLCAASLVEIFAAAIQELRERKP